jgi:hypothetical protein
MDTGKKLPPSFDTTSSFPASRQEINTMPQDDDVDDDGDDVGLLEGSDEGEEALHHSSAASLSTTRRKQMELQAAFLIKSVEEIEATNRQLRSGKRQKIPQLHRDNNNNGSPSSLTRTTAETSGGDGRRRGIRGVVGEEKEMQNNPRSTTDTEFSFPITSALRSNRALVDDLSSCAGITSSSVLLMEQDFSGPTLSLMAHYADQQQPQQPPRTTTMNTTDQEAGCWVADQLREIQSNADLKIRRLLHRVNHLEEQLALSQTDNERLVQQLSLSAAPQPPAHSNKKQGMFSLENNVEMDYPIDDPTQYYVNKLLVRQRALIQENAKIKRELLSSCAACRTARMATSTSPAATAETTTESKQQQQQQQQGALSSPPRSRPTFQSSARHVLKNLPIAPAARHNIIAPTAITTATTTSSSSTTTSQRQNLPLAQRRAWSTTPQSYRRHHPNQYPS